MNRRQFGLSSLALLLTTKLKPDYVPALALQSEFVISEKMAERLGLYDRGILSKETLLIDYKVDFIFN